MLLDISPFRKHRDYRCLFIGQLISIFGSMITYVVLPYQIYELTHSTLAVGLISLVELIPLLVTAFIGGVVADVLDRKKLLIYAEFFIMLIVAVLAINAMQLNPSMWLIYCSAGIISALNGFHRPALDSLGLRLVDKEDIPAYSALHSFKSTLGTIVSPAIGGICIASFGVVATYFIDVASFAISIIALLQIKYFAKNNIVEKDYSSSKCITLIKFFISKHLGWCLKPKAFSW
jgi:MFS family permease